MITPIPDEDAGDLSIPTEVEWELLRDVPPAHRAQMQQVALDAYRQALKRGQSLLIALPRIRESVRAALGRLQHDAQLTEVLCDPAARAGLYVVAPWVRTTLASQVGPRPKAAQAVTGATTKWDEQVVLNEFLTLRRDDDPRETLKDKALKLAEAKGITFMSALETVKQSEPELVERVSKCRPWDQ